MSAPFGPNFLPPAMKLGQGNIFRSVCQEFCSHPGAVHAGSYGQQAGGTHPTGMHTCSEKDVSSRVTIITFTRASLILSTNLFYYLPGQ